MAPHSVFRKISQLKRKRKQEKGGKSFSVDESKVPYFKVQGHVYLKYFFTTF